MTIDYELAFRYSRALREAAEAEAKVVGMVIDATQTYGLALIDRAQEVDRVIELARKVNEQQEPV